jgi:L-arabinokinase
MDQMTSACGEDNALLSLLCQPAELQPSVKLPAGLSFWGLDSGVRHAVSGSDYGSVRTAAFMGYRLLAAKEGDWNGYLANITPRQFEEELADRLPEQMSGQEFLARYSGTTDTVTTVDPARTYKVRVATAHPIYEHDRVTTFRRLLLGSVDETSLRELGRLMYASHESYSACGLGSPGTDLLVKLVREAGSNQGLYGARITGGGSGGTVVVLGRASARNAIDRIVESYERIMRYRPYVFSGSSTGAAHFGAKTLNL